MNAHIPLVKFDPDAHGTACIVIIRPTIPTDALAIARVEVETHGPHHMPFDDVVPLIEKDLIRVANDEVKRRVWVAVVGDEVVGYGKCGFMDSNKERRPGLPAGWYLSGIDVMPRWQRRNIGSRLVRVRLDWLAGQTETVYYNTSVTNEVSVAFHAQFGFEEVPGRARARSFLNEMTQQRLFRRVSTP